MKRNVRIGREWGSGGTGMWRVTKNRASVKAKKSYKWGEGEGGEGRGEGS